MLQRERKFFRIGRLSVGSLLFLFLLLSACSTAPPPSPVAGGLSGRAAWEKLAPVTALKATAVLAWETADGRHGKNRVRIFLAPPGRMKIQWLTPWGSVAGQLLVAGGHFWLSDARRHQTWYGRTSAMAGCFPGQGEVDWVSTSRFLNFWPLLFSVPEEDVKLAVGGEISYSGNLAENRLAKNLLLSDGEQVGIMLEDLEAGPQDKFFARRFTVTGSGGRVVLKLRSYQLPDKLPAETFVYQGKNFNLYPCMDE